MTISSDYLSLSAGGSDVISGGWGTVKTVRCNKDPQLFSMALPASDSSDTILIDLFGVSKTWQLEGVKTGDASTIASFIVALENLANGSQPTRYYNCFATQVSYQVMVSLVSWEKGEGEVSIVRWNIGLMQGNS